MSARALRFDEVGLEFDEVRARTRWTMSLSLAAHLALLLALVLIKPVSQDRPVITEIAFIGPGDLDPSPAAPGPASAPRASAPVSGARVTSDRDDHFRREAVASFAANPQSDRAAADRLNSRLAALQQTTVTPISGGTTGAPSALWASPAGVPGGLGGSGQSVTLSRGGGGGSGPPLALGRGGGGNGTSTTLARVATPAPSGEPAAAAREGESTARRTLAGAMLAGPIADRAVLQSTTPVYPEWAKKDGVEGSVTVYFVVRADGSVKENVLVQKTAGFAEFDDNARAAILAWRFEPLRGGRTGEQWGTITFNYRLRGA